MARSSFGLTISLVPLSDLQTLRPSDRVSISVQVSDLPAGASLTALGAKAVWDPTLFTTPSIAPGTILPNPLAAENDWVSRTADGVADAVFATQSIDVGQQVVQEGEFFRIELLALGAGSGEFRLAFADAFAFDPANPSVPSDMTVVSGPSLAYRIVPEPTSVGWLAGLVTSGCALLHRRGRATSCRTSVSHLA